MKKVLLLCQQCEAYSLESSPARYQLIHELKTLGYEIYVFLPGGIRDRGIKNEICLCVNTSHISVGKIRRRIREIAPEYVLAFTYEDAKILYPLPYTMKKTAFIYYNLEIYTPMEHDRQLTGMAKRIRGGIRYIPNKCKEMIFTKKCRAFVIQDALRKRTAARFFIRHPFTMLIPNTYVYREDIRVKPESRGIVYSGGLNKLQLESLLKGLEHLPDLPVTFSGWSDQWFKGQYKRLCATHPGIKVYTHFMQPDQFSEFLRQYAVGLIWYSPTKDENVNNIGMSSGKFFRHLSLGQPVIVNSCPGLGRIVEKYKLGIVVRDASKLQDAYEKIMDHYSYYQNNVIRVFKDKFDYEKVIRPFLRQMENL